MRRIINKVVSRIKGEQFEIDNNIPLRYLCYFFFMKFFSLLNGMIVSRSFQMIFISPSSKVLCRSKIEFARNLSIGPNCYIDALSRHGITCGSNVSIGKNTCIECSGSLKYLGEGVELGDNVGLGTHGFLGAAGGIKIGAETIIGNYVSFHSENHCYEDLNIPIRLQGVSHKGIIIGSNCWIGAKVTVLDGANVGSGCVIAAGAVVRGVFPDNCVIGGVPAKILKYR